MNNERKTPPLRALVRSFCICVFAVVFLAAGPVGCGQNEPNPPSVGSYKPSESYLVDRTVFLWIGTAENYLDKEEFLKSELKLELEASAVQYGYDPEVLVNEVWETVEGIDAAGEVG